MIRQAQPADARAIAALHATLFDDAWSEAEVAALLAPPAGAGFIAEAPHNTSDTTSSAVCGFIIGRFAADEGEILSVGVANSAKRQGLGHLLVATLVDQARSRATARVYLEVAADNTPALALYRSLGFLLVGKRRNYYSRAGAAPIDALCMALGL